MKDKTMGSHLKLLLVLTLLSCLGCAALRAYTQLPLEEQGLYRAYSRVMSPRQRRTYLALPTAAERTAYARQVGATQALETLSEVDRRAVIQGWPYAGMSKAALRLLWGEPYWQRGPDFDERWYYFGDAFSLAEPGESPKLTDTVMEVALADGQVVWWQERVPSEDSLFFLRRRLFSPAD